MCQPWLATAVVLTAATATSQAGTVSLPARADSTLYESVTGALANGAGQHLFTGITLSMDVRRTLVDFDIAGAVPAGARIVSADLHMTVSRSIYPPALPMSLHRVLESWNEGSANAPGQEGGGTTAATGDVTWLHRNFPSLSWASPGGDYALAASGVSATPIMGPALWQTTNAMVADVQAWLDNPSSNFGWLLRTDVIVPSAARRFDSREHPTVGNRPVLVVTYLQPGNWTAAGDGCGAPVPTLTVSGTLAAGGGLTLTLQGAPGSLAANFLALALLQPPFPLAAGCNLHLSPFEVVTPGLQILDLSGQTQNTLPIPLAPPLSGLPLAGQGAVLDALAPAGFALSNAVYLMLQ